MTMIVPAGNKKMDWSPKEEKLTKTASTGVAEVQEEVNPLYEAAKKFAESKSAKKSDEKACKCGKVPCECAASSSDNKAKSAADSKEVKTAGDFGASSSDSKSGSTSAEAKSDSASTGGSSDGKSSSDNKDGGSSAISGGSSDEGASAIIEIDEAGQMVGEPTVEVAVEKLEEGIADLKEAVGIEGAPATDDAGAPIGEEVAINIPGEAAAVDVAAPSIPGEGQGLGSGPDIIVKSDATPAVGNPAPASAGQGVCSCASAKTPEVKTASTEEEFCKFAHLSPANKKKLANYWVNMLGFPKDYVSLMTKDYEK